MNWWKRLVLGLPFGVALTLTLLVAFRDTLHLQDKRVAGYSFAFGAPWGWLFDGRLPGTHSHFWSNVEVLGEILWLPALMYSATLYMLFRVVDYAIQSRKRPLEQ